MAAAPTVFRNLDIVDLILDYALAHWTRGELARSVGVTREFLYCGSRRLYRTLVLRRTMKLSTAQKALATIASCDRAAQLVRRLDLLAEPTQAALARPLHDALVRAQLLHTLVLPDDVAFPPRVLADVTLPALRRLGMALVVTGPAYSDPFLESHFGQLTHLRLNSASLSALSNVALDGAGKSYWTTLSSLRGGRDLEYFHGSAWLASHLLANSRPPAQEGNGKRLARGCTLFADGDPGAHGDGLTNGYYAKALLDNLAQLPADGVRTLALDARLAASLLAPRDSFPHILHLEIALKEPNHPFYLPMLTRAAEPLLPRFPALRTLLFRVRIAFDHADINSESSELALAASVHLPRITSAAPTASLRAVRYSCHSAQRWWDVRAKAWSPTGPGPCVLFPAGAPLDPFATPSLPSGADARERERELAAEFDTAYVDDALRGMSAAMGV